MSEPFELYVLKDDEVIHRLEITDTPQRVGRAPNCALVLTHDTVSWHHMTVWSEGSQFWVRDLESRNGTFINNTRIRGAKEAQAGDTLRLGTELCIRIFGPSAEVTDTLQPRLMLEDLDAGILMPIQNNRINIGAVADGERVHQDSPEHLATLLVDGANITVTTGVSDFPVTIGKAFEVAGRRLCLVQLNPTRTPTIDSSSTDRHPYRLQIGIDGVNGPFARLSGPLDRSYRVDADNRAVLLYLLGKQRAQDNDASLDPADRGWCSDSDLSTGIWGRGTRDPNSLHVLVYRVRQQLKKAGFDPLFIEKRRLALRICLREVEVS